MEYTAGLVTTAYGPANAAAIETARQTLAEWLQPCHMVISNLDPCGPGLGPGRWPPLDDRLTAWEAAAKSVDLLVSIRGGYGAMEMAAALPETQSPPPPLLGYSDVTALHAIYLRRNWGPSIYGPMPGVTASPSAVNDLRRCLAGAPLDVINNLRGRVASAIRARPQGQSLVAAYECWLGCAALDSCRICVAQSC